MAVSVEDTSSLSSSIISINFSEARHLQARPRLYVSSSQSSKTSPSTTSEDRWFLMAANLLGLKARSTSPA